VYYAPWDIYGMLKGPRKFFSTDSNSTLAFTDINAGHADSKKGLSSKTLHALLFHFCSLCLRKFSLAVSCFKLPFTLISTGDAASREDHCSKISHVVCFQFCSPGPRSFPLGKVIVDCQHKTMGKTGYSINSYEVLGMVANVCNPSTYETEVNEWQFVTSLDDIAYSTPTCCTLSLSLSLSL
jgi:hypothetical protein